MTKITRINITEHLLQYQFNLIGKTIEEAKAQEDWIKTWSVSKEKSEEFSAYAIPLLKKVFKFNTNRAKATFDWFQLNFGLKIV